MKSSNISNKLNSLKNSKLSLNQAKQYLNTIS